MEPILAMKSKTTIQRIPITKARPDLRKVARQVHNKQGYIILEENGKPIAGVMDIAEMEDYLELQDPKLKRQIEEGYQAYLRGKCKDANELLQELKSKAKTSSRKPRPSKRK